MDLTFGDLNFRVTHTGILRLGDSSRHESSDSEKLARQENGEDEIGSEPDSPIPTHSHLYFVAMARRAPPNDSDGEEQEEADPKSWAEMDAELGINLQKTPPLQDQEIGDGERAAGRSGGIGSRKEAERK